MKPWPALNDYGRTISLSESGVDLFLFDAGYPDRPVILLVHGLGDEADTWRHLIPFFAPSHRVLAPDLPGFGRSGKLRRRLSPPFLASVLLELLDALEISQALLVGNSLGGLLCQHIALSQPERASGLVLLSGSMVATRQSLNMTMLLFMIPGIGEWMYTRLPGSDAPGRPRFSLSAGQ
jgi:pimeloyl-ACP methyl ester carboxylesterase